jgi:YggT family protein
MHSFLVLIDTVVNLYIWGLVIFVVVNWLIAFKVINPTNRFVYLAMDFLYRITEPVLRPIRSVMPNLGGLDISPVLLILALTFARNLMWEYLGRM